MAISLARFIVYNMDYDVSDADGSKSIFYLLLSSVSLRDNVSCFSH
jgi:hypothetical protein